MSYLAHYGGALRERKHKRKLVRSRSREPELKRYLDVAEPKKKRRRKRLRPGVGPDEKNIN